jgi:hypothetical protein
MQLFTHLLQGITIGTSADVLPHQHQRQLELRPAKGILVICAEGGGVVARSILHTMMMNRQRVSVACDAQMHHAS